MDECQVIMGVEEGKRMRELVERITGDVCPCSKGQRCPLLPQPRRGE